MVGLPSPCVNPTSDNRLIALTLTGKENSALPESVPIERVHQEPRKDVSVLVAEDNPVNREVTAEMLAVEGYHAHTVCNGREAVEALMNRTFDLVFMDCQMPEMDGFAATASIRSREKDLGLPRVPIVALTAHAIAGDRERCLAQDMDDYLSKPFRQTQLITVVRRWVPQSRSSPSNKPDSIGQAASVVAAASESTDCLDEPILHGLRALRRPGRPDIYVDLLSRYLDSSRQSIEAMRQHIAAQNAAELFQNCTFPQIKQRDVRCQNIGGANQKARDHSLFGGFVVGTGCFRRGRKGISSSEAIDRRLVGKRSRLSHCKSLGQ